MSVKKAKFREFTGIDISRPGDDFVMDSGDYAMLGVALDARNIDTRAGSIATAKGYARVFDSPVRFAVSYKPVLVMTCDVTEENGEFIFTLASGAGQTEIKAAKMATNRLSGLLFKDMLTNCKINTAGECKITAVAETAFTATLPEDQTVITAGTGVDITVSISRYRLTRLIPHPGIGAYYATGYNGERRFIVLSDNMNVAGIGYGRTNTAHVGSARDSILAVYPQHDALRTQINGMEYILIADGQGQIIKARYDDGLVLEPFGSSAHASDIHVNYMATYYERLFAAGDPDNPCRLYWSKLPGDARSVEDWTADETSVDLSGGFVNVGASEGDPIIGLFAMPDQLLIFKRHSLYRLYGYSPSSYTIERISGEIQPSANTAITMHGLLPYWITANGIYYFDGSTTQLVENARNVRRILAREGLSVEFCKAEQAGDTLYFLLNHGGASYGDTILEYDILRGSVMLRDGFQIVDICTQDNTLYCLTADGYICAFGEGTTYDGKPYDAYWKTHALDLGSKMRKKKIRGIYLRAEGRPAVTLIGDGRAQDMRQGGSVNSPDRSSIVQRLVPSGVPVMTMQLVIGSRASNPFDLNGSIELDIEHTEVL